VNHHTELKAALKMLSHEELVDVVYFYCILCGHDKLVALMLSNMVDNIPSEELGPGVDTFEKIWQHIHRAESERN